MRIMKIHASNKKEFLDSLQKVIEELENDEPTPVDLYHFPDASHIAKDSKVQVNKVIEEMAELITAFNIGEPEECLMEAWDLIHATETLMRMVADDSEVISAYQHVLEKNYERGYYV